MFKGCTTRDASRPGFPWNTLRSPGGKGPGREESRDGTAPGAALCPPAFSGSSLRHLQPRMGIGIRIGIRIRKSGSGAQRSQLRPCSATCRPCRAAQAGVWILREIGLVWDVQNFPRKHNHSAFYSVSHAQTFPWGREGGGVQFKLSLSETHWTHKVPFCFSKLSFIRTQ